MYRFTLETTGRIMNATFDHEKEIIGEYSTKEEAAAALKSKYDLLSDASRKKFILRSKYYWLDDTLFIAKTRKRGWKTIEILRVEYAEP